VIVVLIIINIKLSNTEIKILIPRLWRQLVFNAFILNSTKRAPQSLEPIDSSEYFRIHTAKKIGHPGRNIQIPDGHPSKTSFKTKLGQSYTLFWIVKYRRKII